MLFPSEPARHHGCPSSARAGRIQSPAAQPTVEGSVSRMRQFTHRAPLRPAPWTILLAFALVYLAWGTTYLAIKAGVRQFPPGLFGGLRLTAAGLIIFAFLALRGEPLRLRARELFWVGLAGVLL